MSDLALKVENLGKRYRIGVSAPYHRVSEVLVHLGRAALKAPQKLFQGRASAAGADQSDGEGKSDEFWALRDVSFDVRQGEVIGIIGANGAGKSTLLKILSRITEPTTGRFGVRGRVGSLLEVGTGFHPELTGRENLYLSGTILGMTRAEVKRQSDDIVAFADIGEFLDTPVKRYSSGMKVRLGFAVAAHLQPEILIVDEVLAVGDAAFQKKCITKMSEVAAGGRTVLLVSHNMAAIQAICTRAIVIDAGRVVMEGAPVDAVAHYRKISGSTGQMACAWVLDEAPGSEEARLLAMKVEPALGQSIDVESGVRVSLRWFNTIENQNIDCTMRVVSEDGVILFQRGTVVCSNGDSKEGVYSASTTIPSGLLNNGTYRIGILFGQDRTRALALVEDVVEFTVHNLAQQGKWSPPPGLIRPDLEWTSAYLGAEADSVHQSSIAAED